MPPTAVEPTSAAPPGNRPAPGRSIFWVIAIAGAAQFIASLDNLVVTMALPVIRERLHAGLAGLEWTVNAYTLTFAVLLLTGAALGDRFGRRRMFITGLVIFTTASAAAALAPNITALIAARAFQGAGGAMLVPLSLTLLSAGVPAAKRNMALGIWGALGGLAVAVGPLIGGAIVQGVSWQFIFWVNVPLGVALVPLTRLRLSESRGASGSLDLLGVVLASLGLFGVVLGLVRGGQTGWTSAQVLAGFFGGAALLAGFIVHERRRRAPMLPLRVFRSRQFTVVNAVALLMSFGMFGSIFLLAQFLQTVQHYSPLSAGLRTLPWTGMPVLIAPLAALLIDRVGGRRLIAAGLGLMAMGLAWLAVVISPHVAYNELVPAFVLSGVGMSLFFVPVASVVLSAVSPSDEGVASGTNNAIRELGGVLGIAVLGAVFAGSGGYATGAFFVAGLTPAIWVGAAVLGIGTLTALALPQVRRVTATPHDGEPALEPVAA